jgi:hypothetical protein
MYLAAFPSRGRFVCGEQRTEEREVRGQQSFNPAVAIEKLLRGAKRSLVHFLRTFLQTESDAELSVRRLFVRHVPDIQFLVR